MNAEAEAAIKIADKHLAGKPPQARMALAKDIVQAIIDHAERVALDAIKTASARRWSHRDGRSEWRDLPVIDVTD